MIGPDEQEPVALEAGCDSRRPNNFDLTNRLYALAYDMGVFAKAQIIPPAETGQCHPNCEQHGKSPCEGIRCDGSEDPAIYSPASTTATEIDRG